jgi:hypothetical protein
MLAGILIIASSLALFVYWFRYSCILILRNRCEAAEASKAVLDGRFSFSEVRERLKSGLALAPLEACLERDYRVLTYLIEHAAGLELESLEDRLLIFDYRVMQCVYRLSRTVAPVRARKALSEMASVLGVLAHRIGEQAGVQAEA